MTSPTIMPDYTKCAICKEQDDGASRDRTGDLLLAKQALSQLSYGPAWGECTPEEPSSEGRRRVPWRSCDRGLGHSIERWQQLATVARCW
jgi:hypothetical protein